MGVPTGCSPKGRKPVRASAEACPKAGHLEKMLMPAERLAILMIQKKNFCGRWGVKMRICRTGIQIIGLIEIMSFC